MNNCGGGEMIWKTGDWCFFEHKLCQIKRVEDGDVVEVSDGWFSVAGGLTNLCFPVSLANKRISDRFEEEYQKLYKYTDNAWGVNWAAITKEINTLFYQACMADTNNGAIYYTKKLEEFCKSVQKAFDEKCEISISGVRIFLR